MQDIVVENIDGCSSEGIGSPTRAANVLDGKLGQCVRQYQHNHRDQDHKSPDPQHCTQKLGSRRRGIQSLPPSRSTRLGLSIVTNLNYSTRTHELLNYRFGAIRIGGDCDIHHRSGAHSLWTSQRICLVRRPERGIKELTRADVIRHLYPIVHAVHSIDRSHVCELLGI